MTDPFEMLHDAPRLLMQARLVPLQTGQGGRFQPTGFADLGPARYKTYTRVNDKLPPDEENMRPVEMLLVESAQSVANWLEAMSWEPPQLGRMSSPNAKLAAPLDGMPYVRVNNRDGTPLTNSILEAHRLNSPYILPNKTTAFCQTLQHELGASLTGPLDVQQLARVVFKYDPNSVLHGVMLEEIAGRLRLTRLISGFIEASDVADAAYGGVMNNIVNPKGIEGHGGSSNIIYHRSDFTGKLVLYFNLDLAQMRAFTLGTAAERFLTAMALYKVRRFLRTGLRLRTACDLEVDGELTVTRPRGFVVPDEKALGELLRDAVTSCRRDGLFADITTLAYPDQSAASAESSISIDLPPDLPPPSFPEPLLSRVEVQKVRKKLKLVIKGELTDELVEEIKRQFPDPARIGELIAKAKELK